MTKALQLPTYAYTQSQSQVMVPRVQHFKGLSFQSFDSIYKPSDIHSTLRYWQPENHLTSPVTYKSIFKKVY